MTFVKNLIQQIFEYVHIKKLIPTNIEDKWNKYSCGLSVNGGTPKPPISFCKKIGNMFLKLFFLQIVVMNHFLQIVAPDNLLEIRLFNYFICKLSL